jgi:hypothetical protein
MVEIMTKEKEERVIEFLRWLREQADNHDFRVIEYGCCSNESCGYCEVEEFVVERDSSEWYFRSLGAKLVGPFPSYSIAVAEYALDQVNNEIWAEGEQAKGF